MPVESVLHVVDLSDKNVSHQIEETWDLVSDFKFGGACGQSDKI